MSSLFDWFANIRKTEAPVQKQQEREIADGLWTKCNSCGAVAYTKDLEANQLVCLECGHHNRVDSDERINVNYGKILFRHLKSKQKELVIVKNGKHLGLGKTGGDSYFEQLISFINKHSKE